MTELTAEKRAELRVKAERAKRSHGLELTMHAALRPSVVLSLLDALDAAEAKLADAVERREHTEQWYAERCKRLWHWAHADKEHRGEYFSIIANGVADPFEVPTYAQLLNMAKHRAEKAESDLATLQAKRNTLAAAHAKPSPELTAVEVTHNAEAAHLLRRSVEDSLESAREWPPLAAWLDEDVALGLSAKAGR